LIILKPPEEAPFWVEFIAYLEGKGMFTEAKLVQERMIPRFNFHHHVTSVIPYPDNASFPAVYEIIYWPTSETSLILTSTCGQ
jgi:hypothetical protein